MARMTGSLLITARDGSGWESAGDGRADGAVVENAERGTANAEQARLALARLFRVPPSAFPVSQDPIHQRTQEHHDADNAIGGEESRIEPRQVSRLHEPMLPCDQRCAESNADLVGNAQPPADPEHDQRDPS